MADAVSRLKKLETAAASSSPTFTFGSNPDPKGKPKSGSRRDRKPKPKSTEDTKPKQQPSKGDTKPKQQPSKGDKKTKATAPAAAAAPADPKKVNWADTVRAIPADTDWIKVLSKKQKKAPRPFKRPLKFSTSL